MPAPAAIGWLTWSAHAFALARREARPVLLSIAAPWSAHCERMDRDTFADPAVAAAVSSGFVAVRVDPDRRPDIALRYGLGGWPTTAFLTPDGDVLGGGTYVDAARLTPALARVTAAFASGEHLRAIGGWQAADEAGDGAARPLVALEDIEAGIDSTFDHAHGGYGGAPKFPLTAPVHLALDTFRRTGAEAARERAIATLDAIGWGPLFDAQDGGFFHYAEAADWSAPSREKLLDVNAGLLSLYVDAFVTLQRARYAERAESVLGFVQTWLADQAHGGWGAFQRPAGSEPSDGVSGRVDDTLFTDWNGRMISAAIAAGHALSDPGLTQFALTSLDRIALLCYRPGAGVAHYSDGHGAYVRGLLDDQMAMAAAHLDAFEAAGDIVQAMMAEELALFALRLLWDESGGGFFDRAGDESDVGRLRVRVKPFAGNCAAARVLYRLARVAEKRDYAERADRTLAAVARRAPLQGPLAAEFVLAARPPSQ